MSVKKWISMIVMLAFAVTAVPAVSHAEISHDDDSIAVKSVQVRAPSHEGCAGHNGQHKDVHQKADKKGAPGTPCCDGKACKCVNGSCGGLVKTFGPNHSGLISPHVIGASFSFEQLTAVSDFYSRINRPPRA